MEKQFIKIFVKAVRFNRLEKVVEFIEFYKLNPNSHEITNILKTTLFLFCIRRKNLQILDYLLKNSKIEVDDYGIFEAIRVKSVEIVKYLVENDLTNLRLQESKHWNTPLLYALKRFQKERSKSDELREIILYLKEKSSKSVFSICNKNNLRVSDFNYMFE